MPNTQLSLKRAEQNMWDATFNIQDSTLVKKQPLIAINYLPKKEANYYMQFQGDTMLDSTFPSNKISRVVPETSIYFLINFCYDSFHFESILLRVFQ